MKKNAIITLGIALFIAALLLPEHCLAETPINLRVAWTESPQTKAMVLWDSVNKGKGELQIREDGKAATSKSLPAKITEAIDAKGKNNKRITFYSVALTDLKPSTKYFLTAKIGEEKTSEHYFITAPDKDIDFKLFFVGDSRTRLDKTRAVSQFISEKFAKDPTYIGLLHGGDMANRPTVGDWIPWLAAYSLTTTKDGRLLPIIPVRGNHEQKKSEMFDKAYGVPGQAIKNYYTCMLSPQVAIVVLNSEYSAEGDQKVFLEKSLAMLRSKRVRFQMTAYHRALFPAIKKPHRGRKAWVPLFEKYNIDLGLESDGHCIKRTLPIRGEKLAKDGIVYLGEGGYGAPQRTYKGKHWYLESPAFVNKGDHYMSLSFTKDKIIYSTEQLGKGKVDSATFHARKR